MKVLVQRDSFIERILGSQKERRETEYRFLTYCVRTQVTEGELIYNVLTKELLLVSPGEDCEAYLKEHWFKVPKDHDDQKLALELRSFVCMLSEQTEEIFDYTILTTTECNARCFYCYEKNKMQSRMSPETAEKVLAFIRAHSDRKVNINWFGGEPLYNSDVIDRISEGLQDREYRSTMVTNGYLFSRAVIEKAVSLWHLEEVQITLDGTEDVYNTRKAYIYKDAESPFRRVIDNMEGLLKHGVHVHIRLNIDRTNYSDMCRLVDFLEQKFSGYPNCTVYSSVLYQCLLDDEVQKKHIEIEKRLRQAGLGETRTLFHTTIKYHQCQADSNHCILITPEGHLGKCEHAYDTDLCGTVEDGVICRQKADLWKKYLPSEASCRSCPVFPNCVRIARCELFRYQNGLCTDIQRRKRVKDVEISMKNTWAAIRSGKTEILMA